ncbi:MAG: tryptophan synthase subunit alpha [Fibrobacteres bacterium]|nr:tryptophan synthase subunit alpha [Fibrobacterota bacterium]
MSSLGDSTKSVGDGVKGPGASVAKGNRIDAVFARLKEKKQKAFIPYLVAGVPGRKETVEMVLELEKLGADIIEFGYPFSDPMADGVVNQAAANKALELGVDAEAYFGMVADIRAKSQIPLIVFSYLNPIYKYGMEAFAVRAKAAGMDGLLLVDMPVEEADAFRKVCDREGLALIFLAAPTTTPARLAKMLQSGSGFLYYISRTGITGERDTFQQDFEAKLGAIKAGSKLPVVVGFGISTPAHVRTVCRLADGAVVGSALVRRTMEDKPFPAMLADLKAFAAPLISPTKESWT